MDSDGLASKKVVVTGAAGFLGCRLAEMLVEKGAMVIATDVRECPERLRQLGCCRWETLDVTNRVAVVDCFGGADYVVHAAALVGPFHEASKFWEINVVGTRNVVSACNECRIPKLIHVSSACTRMTGQDMEGLRFEDLPLVTEYSNEYVRTKTMALRELRSTDSQTLILILAPHQIYGPYDTLFLPNYLKQARAGRLRVIGPGDNRISTVYVDNFCHGIILGLTKLDASLHLKEFLVIDSNAPAQQWQIINKAVMACGFPSLFDKFKVPFWVCLALGHLLQLLGRLRDRPFVLTPYTARMSVINRWFDMSSTEEHLGYAPIVPFEEGWQKTVEFFQTHPQLY